MPEEVEEEKKGLKLVELYAILIYFLYFITDETLYDTTDKKKEKEKAAAEKKAEIEKVKERERQKHIRPWDKSKISSKNRRSTSESESDEKEWKPEKERHVMSQSEWVEKQRKDRKQEFAPVNFVKSNEVFNPHDDEEPNKTLFFTTTKKFKRRNQEVESVTEPKVSMHQGAAIPPPATFDYYGPTSSKQHRHASQAVNLDASISAGLKFLRDQVDKGNKFKFEASTEYKDMS